MLAEDRILSYAVVLMAHEPVRTSFVPDALFFFESETEAENALQQSRRWTNGTVAGFIWLFASGIKFREKRRMVYVLVFCQLIMYFIVALSPALWTIGLHFSLQRWQPNGSAIYSYGLTLLYMGMYVLFVLLHSDPTPGRPRLHVWLFHILTLMNVFVAVLPIAALIPEFTDGCANNDGWMEVGGMSLQCWILGGAVVGTILLPFLLALLFDLYSIMPALNKRPVSRRQRNCPYGLSFLCRGWGSVTLEMLSSCIFFYAFLPTKVSVYPAYAFSRTWELTWGNKPSDSLLSITTSKTQKQLETTKRGMLQLSQVISYSLLIANILLFLCVSELGAKNGVLVILTSFILIWALLQMFLSLLWILSKLLLFPILKAFRLVFAWGEVVSTKRGAATVGGYGPPERDGYVPLGNENGNGGVRGGAQGGRRGSHPSLQPQNQNKPRPQPAAASQRPTTGLTAGQRNADGYQSLA
jgi:hypothetical protein